MTEVPVDDVESFSWEFGPEWSGALIEIRDSNGNTLVGFSVPEGGGVWNGTVTAPSLEGAGVFIDGVSVVDLALASSGDGLGDFAERPGFGFSFDSTYLDHDWEIRRPDGTVAAGGSVNSLGQVFEGSLTLPAGQSGEVWVRQNFGDGMGAQWVSTGVTIQGSSTTYYSFGNNPNPAPTPAPPVLPTGNPSPSPVPTVTPLPTPVSVVASASPTPGEDVSVDVPLRERPETDDGEADVISEVSNAGQKLIAIGEDANEAFNNIALTYGEFSKLAFGGVGRNCELQFGSVTIKLAGIVPEFVRNGMKLIILLTTVFAAIGYAWNTFR